MAQKLSSLDETLTSIADKTVVDAGFIPIVINQNNQFVNKKISLINYWTYILQAKVAGECERHKSIYNFDGTIIDGGGGSSGSEISDQDLASINSRLQVLEQFKTDVPSTYVGISSFNSLQSTVNNNTSGINSLQLSLSNLSNVASDYNTKKLTKLYIKVVDKYGTLVNGYSFDIDNGLSVGVTTFPATGVIELKTEDVAQAMYHLELSTAVNATYNSNAGKYTITIGQLSISKPSNTATQYVGGNIGLATMTIDPSWAGAPTLQSNLNLNQNIVGTYNFTFEYESETDELVGDEYFTVTIRIGNWEQTFTLSPNITITGNISTDIITSQ